MLHKDNYIVITMRDSVNIFMGYTLRRLGLLRSSAFSLGGLMVFPLERGCFVTTLDKKQIV